MTDPHYDHYLTQGPYAIAGRFLGVCRCGLELRGITRDDVYRLFLEHLYAEDDRDG
jgi:hypothetical protein